MEKVITLEEALKRIKELENENAELREELEYYILLISISQFDFVIQEDFSYSSCK